MSIKACALDLSLIIYFDDDLDPSSEADRALLQLKMKKLTEDTWKLLTEAVEGQGHTLERVEAEVVLGGIMTPPEEMM